MSVLSSLLEATLSPLARALMATGGGGGFVSLVNDGILAPFMTFTRSSTALRYNSAGLLETVAANAPRYDYDPTTVTRANLLRNSVLSGSGTSFHGWVYTNAGGTVRPASSTAYAGDTALESVSAIGDRSFLSQLITLSPGEVMTFSVTVESYGGTHRNQVVSGTGSVSVDYLVGGVSFGHGDGIGVDGERLSVRLTNSGGSVISFSVRLGVGCSRPMTTATTTRISRPQVERGSTATAYIPTGILQRGPNVVVDDGFDDPAYWTTVGAATVSGGFANLSGVSEVFRDGSALVAGRAYEAEILVSSISGGPVAVRTNATVRGTTSVAGIYRVPFVATVTGERIKVAGATGVTAAIDYLRIREINHDYNSPRGDATLRGLLIEEQRTNLYTHSDQLNDASWGVSGMTVAANSSVAPDGTNTADLLVPTSGASALKHIVKTSLHSNGPMVFSVYVKPAGYNFFSLTADNNVGRLTLNLVDGTFRVYAGTVSATRVAVGNGWYRVIFTVPTGAGFRIMYGPNDSQRDPVASWSGNGTSGAHVWGAQLEAGTFATSYIPTVATALTRSADVATAPLTSIGWNAVASAVFAEYIVPWSVPGATRGVAAVDTSGRFIYFTTALTPMMFDGVNILSGPAISQGAVSKTASTFSVDGMALCSNGGAVSSGAYDGTFGASPTVLRIGVNAVGNELCGHVRRLRYYPRRLTNAQLQALTA